MRSKWLWALVLAGCTRGNPGLSIEGEDLAVPADLAAGGDLGAGHDLARSADLARSRDLAGLDLSAVPDLAQPQDLAVPLDLQPARDLATVIDLSNTSCVPAANDSLQYVDPVLGTDDSKHGGAPGACAYKTLTFALGRAKGTLSLAQAIYGPGAETLPFTLDGTQQLQCHGATLRGSGGSAMATVILQGTQNAMSECVVDGTGAGSICIYVSSTPTSPHTIAGGSVTRCGGTGIYVAGAVAISGVNVSNVAIDGILWYATSGTMTNNTFTANTRDIDCPNATSSGITGSGNMRVGGGSPVCTGCAHCPF